MQEKKLGSTKEATYSRNIHIARAMVNGETGVATGRKYGISGNRVAQITEKVRRHCMHPLFLEQTTPPDDHGIVEMRQHKEYWLSRIDAVAKYWGV